MSPWRVPVSSFIYLYLLIDRHCDLSVSTLWFVKWPRPWALTLTSRRNILQQDPLWRPHMLPRKRELLSFWNYSLENKYFQTDDRRTWLVKVFSRSSSCEKHLILRYLIYHYFPCVGVLFCIVCPKVSNVVKSRVTAESIAPQSFNRFLGLLYRRSVISCYLLLMGAHIIL